MSEYIKIKLGDEVKEYPKGIVISDILNDSLTNQENIITLALFNNKIIELNKTLEKDGELKFLDLTDSSGMRTYRRSCILLMQKALDELYPVENYDIRVLHSLGEGFYCCLNKSEIVTADFIQELEDKMHQLVDLDLNIDKYVLRTEEVRKIFNEQGAKSKATLFKYRINSWTNIYDIDGTKDYYYGYMVPSTGCLKLFKLYQYDEGFLILFPSRNEPSKVAEFNPPKKLFNVLKESIAWSKVLNVPTIAELNDTVCKGKATDLILVQEALMEEKIANMAKDIATGVVPKFIMIAGPSSSGKTTFSYRLSIQLAACGLRPHPIALDDYFIDRDLVPLDEFGDKDFESIRAIDIEAFNKDMSNLLAGEEVELPVYDFIAGKKKSSGKKLKLGKEDVLVIEGIHGLNDDLSYSLPKESKHKIYISALNVLSIDEQNPLSTSDCRLLRRIIRDNRTRGYNAAATIAMWPAVQRGERKNIFPYQECADVLFNTAHIYEMSVISLIAKPLLYDIDPNDPSYGEAKRLLKFLNYVVPIPTDNIPINSIVREFIGGGCFGV